MGFANISKSRRNAGANDSNALVKNENRDRDRNGEPGPRPKLRTRPGSKSSVRLGLESKAGTKLELITRSFHWIDKEFYVHVDEAAGRNDEFHDRRPSTAVNNKNINAVRCMNETGRYVTYGEIRASLGIDWSQIQSILQKHLGMKKLCSRWIPHNLTEAQKTDPITWCNAMLTTFKEGASN
ncbi:hypothetical protein EVAR_18259_1 [Eumeta japonica]|uniref:Histone-lysine N-methyltransferase SETMAR n=1 Tax=Eumeta variegata TaxID=151549 RepID=A0A4C1UKY0_EUMVA|nr:hypothetical protein EVAR_18259_1 [Eumeta japonica]